MTGSLLECPDESSDSDQLFIPNIGTRSNAARPFNVCSTSVSFNVGLKSIANSGNEHERRQPSGSWR